MMKLVTIEYRGRRSVAVVIARGYVAHDILNEEKRSDWPTDMKKLVESGVIRVTAVLQAVEPLHELGFEVGRESRIGGFAEQKLEGVGLSRGSHTLLS